MAQIRKPFQGVSNILCFNWHFYIIALLVVFVLVFTANYSPFPFFNYVLCAFIVSSTLISLLVSFYVYDLSSLYCLSWIESDGTENLIVNINAGFDETSHLLEEKFDNAELVVFDFYNPKTHTEVSIKRARNAYPPFPHTQTIDTNNLKLANNSADKIFLILSAHEIRNQAERDSFFKELYRIIKPTGEIYVTEHLRDLPNFLAYNIGFFHFYSKNNWLKTFNTANLNLKQEIKITPFISTFILHKNGNTP
jgi:SAM-dependent methyltransferase